MRMTAQCAFMNMCHVCVVCLICVSLLVACKMNFSVHHNKVVSYAILSYHCEMYGDSMIFLFKTRGKTLC